jgi:hypothetical protein
MGIASPLFTRRIEPAADALVRQVRERTATPEPATAALPPGQAGGAASARAAAAPGAGRSAADPATGAAR